jgi:hypothetical protein
LQANAIFYIATGREQWRSAVYLAEVVRKRIAIPYPELQAIVDEAGVLATMSEDEAHKRLQPFGARILTEVYRRLGERSRAQGMTPVWIFLPQLLDGAWQAETPQAQALAEAAGFTAINLSDVFRGQAVEKLRVEEWDDHPNALAHRLLAQRMYAELARRVPALFASASR